MTEPEQDRMMAAAGVLEVLVLDITAVMVDIMGMILCPAALSMRPRMSLRKAARSLPAA